MPNSQEHFCIDSHNHLSQDAAKGPHDSNIILDDMNAWHQQ